MSKSKETYQKKEVRKKKEKKKKEKERKKMEKKDQEKKNSLDDMIAYVDEDGNISDTPPDSEEKGDIKADEIETSVPKKEPYVPSDEVRKGRVTFFNDSKGFGFIEDLVTRDRLFLHVSNFREEIQENDIVTFKAEMGERGLVAKEVSIFRE